VSCASCRTAVTPTLAVRSRPHRGVRRALQRAEERPVAPLVVGGQINPALADNHIRVIPDTHGKTSHLNAAQVEALSTYLKSLQK